MSFDLCQNKFKVYRILQKTDFVYNILNDTQFC